MYLKLQMKEICCSFTYVIRKNGLIFFKHIQINLYFFYTNNIN